MSKLSTLCHPIERKYLRASVKTVNDLFNKTVSIDAADIDYEVMIKMIMEKTAAHAEAYGKEGEKEVEEESDSRPAHIWGWKELKTTVSRAINNYREDFGEGLSKVREKELLKAASFIVDPGDWEKIGEALENRKIDTSENLKLMGQIVLQMKIVNGEIQIRKYDGMESTFQLCKELNLSKKMISDHMPPAYSELFSIETCTDVDLSVFDLLI